MKPRTFVVRVSCVLGPGVSTKDLHPIDRDESPLGTYDFHVLAGTESEAEELALDEFHLQIPIKVLDYFQIDAEVIRVIK